MRISRSATAFSRSAIASRRFCSSSLARSSFDNLAKRSPSVRAFSIAADCSDSHLVRSAAIIFEMSARVKVRSYSCLGCSTASF